MRSYERAYFFSECPYYTLDSSDPLFYALQDDVAVLSELEDPKLVSIIVDIKNCSRN